MEGQKVWLVVNRYTVAFAASPRYVPQNEWDLEFDEIISDASHILSDKRAEADMYEPEPFGAIIEHLVQVELVVIREGQRLFDSFASQDTFENAVVPAIEKWDMNQPDGSD